MALLRPHLNRREFGGESDGPVFDADEDLGDHLLAPLIGDVHLHMSGRYQSLEPGGVISRHLLMECSRLRVELAEQATKKHPPGNTCRST